MRILCVIPRYDYGDRSRGLSFEQTNFVTALEGMGHTVSVFDYLSELQEHGRRAMNSKLIEAAVDVEPHLAFFSLFRYEVKKRAVRAVSRMGIPTFNWFSDDHWRFESFSRFYAPVFDWVSTTDAEAVAKYRRVGYHHALLTQWGFNRYSYGRATEEKRYDVTFVGQPHGERRQVIDALRAADISVECFGHGWPRGRLSHEQMIEVFSSSRINLNMSASSTGASPQIKGRVFEVPGCGGFLMTDPAARLGEFLVDGQECVIYDDVDDLIDKIRYYLAHEEERLAIELAGERRVLAEHTYDHRFDDLFSRMGLTQQGVAFGEGDEDPKAGEVMPGWRAAAGQEAWRSFFWLADIIGEERAVAAGRRARRLVGSRERAR